MVHSLGNHLWGEMLFEGRSVYPTRPAEGDARDFSFLRGVFRSFHLSQSPGPTGCKLRACKALSVNLCSFDSITFTQSSRTNRELKRRTRTARTAGAGVEVVVRAGRIRLGPTAGSGGGRQNLHGN